MTQTEKNIWIRLASGTAKGPFPASKVRDAYRVGNDGDPHLRRISRLPSALARVGSRRVV